MDVTNHNRKKKREVIPPMEYGKVPPQAQEMERAILGAIMLERSAFSKASAILTAECFYHDSHIKLFEAFTEMSRKGIPIDILTTVEEMNRREELEQIGGSYFITKLTNEVASSANIEHHSDIVYKKHVLRKLIEFGGNMITSAYEGFADPEEIMAEYDKDYASITADRGANDITHIKDEMVERMQRIMGLQQQQSSLTGIPSGFKGLDDILHGWQRTDLIILAARPAVGKTAFSLNLARNATTKPSPSGKKVRVLLFSMEMSKGQLVDRIMSAQSEMWLEKIVTGKIDSDEFRQLYTKGVQPLSEAGIYIDDTPDLTIQQLTAKSNTFFSKLKKDEEMMIIIDYLQLMSGPKGEKNQNREQVISDISRGLKTLAKRLKIPVIALAQLSRALEQRTAKDGGKTPQLSDLRESGSIEQNADRVLFIYRPEYHGITADSIGEDTSGLTEIKIAKNRHGKLGTVKLKALLHIQKFIDCEDQIVGLTAPTREMPTSTWRAIGENNTTDEDDGFGDDRIYVQTGSKMNDLPRDEDDDPPF